MWTEANILGVFLSAVLCCWAQECKVIISDTERRDCYPWPGADLTKCEARGCVWCPASSFNYPYCYYDDTVCPSTIADSSRVDCHPEVGATKEVCNQRGCIWCLPQTNGYPACFYDQSVSQGGAVCPSDVTETERIDCHPEPNASQESCLKRGCFWCSSTTSGAPFCFMPKERGFKLQGSVSETSQGYTARLVRVNTPSLYGSDIQQIQLNVEYQTDNRLRIKLFDPNSARWEVPIAISGTGQKPPNPAYRVTFSNDPVFSLKVTRVSSGAVIFDTSIGGLEFSDQFLQFATYLNTNKLFGFGEFERHTNKYNMSWERWGMWTRDQGVGQSNLYGQYPVYLNVEQDAKAHMGLVLNSNAQDVTLMPHPAMTFRTIGGILDIYLFLGSSPEEAVQQYHQAVGFPVMPPYWALGFQLCRWGYADLADMQATIGRMRQYDIPHDIQYGDIDYMDAYKDFTIDQVKFAGLPQYVEELKAQGTRYISILDPGISSTQPSGTYPTFENGQAANVWIMDGSVPFQGEVWPGLVYYPDFSKQSTEDWWVQECITFKQQLDYAGLWIDMNEPSNFIHGRPGGCADTPLNNPPYLPDILDNLWTKTLCMEAQQEMGIFYNVHSLYGWSMSKATHRAVREVSGKRSVTFTRSAFPGTGQWAQHWLGDNWSEWSNLKWSIIGMFDFNLFGMPYNGADICGFQMVTTEEMCLRWQQLGAFYPFSRNHNAAGNPPQDPGVWESVGTVTSSILRVRYTLLPYLYTLFHNVHVKGGTVVRPLYFEFPNDAMTYSIDFQFLWGTAFMVTAVLEKGATSVQAYFPDDPWYDYYTGTPVVARGQLTTLAAPLESINLHIRGGYVLPTQEPANSTMFSRLNPMGLLSALNDSGAATGELFWDDGDSQDTQEKGLYFHATYNIINRELVSTVLVDGYSELVLTFKTFTFFGVPDVVNAVFINGVQWSSWSYDVSAQVLKVNDALVPVRSNFNVTWTI